MARGKQALIAKGYSDSVASRICEPQAKSTRAIYDSKWKLYKEYCVPRKLDPEKVSAPQLGDFLTYLFDEKQMMPATIEGYRTAIAGALKHQSGVNLGKDQTLTDLLAWMHRQRPRASRMVPQWDLKLVLLALQEPPFEPIQDAEKVPLHFLTWKTVFLTLLASGNRRGEVHALEYKSFQHDPKWRYIVLRPSPEFISKTQLRTQGASKLEFVKIQSICDFVGPDLDRDRKLCPVRCIKAYVARTQHLRRDKKLFFVSYKPSHSKDIHKNTISGWIRKLITFVYHNASEETHTLAGTSTHTIRGMAATLAYRGGVDVEDILQACSWANQTTFTDFYLKDLSLVQDGVSSLGPLSVAQSSIK